MNKDRCALNYMTWVFIVPRISMEKKIQLLIYTAVFLLSVTCHAHIVKDSTPAEIRAWLIDHLVYMDDLELLYLAKNKGIVPETIPDGYVRQELNKGNTITAWILQSREDKLSIVDGLKEDYKRELNIIVFGSSETYVDLINGMISYHIDIGKTTPDKGLSGLGGIFKSYVNQRALMEQIEAAR